MIYNKRNRVSDGEDRVNKVRGYNRSGAYTYSDALKEHNRSDITDQTMELAIKAYNKEIDLTGHPDQARIAELISDPKFENFLTAYQMSNSKKTDAQLLREEAMLNAGIERKLFNSYINPQPRQDNATVSLPPNVVVGYVTGGMFDNEGEKVTNNPSNLKTNNAALDWSEGTPFTTGDSDIYGVQDENILSGLPSWYQGAAGKRYKEGSDQDLGMRGLAEMLRKEILSKEALSEEIMCHLICIKTIIKQYR